MRIYLVRHGIATDHVGGAIKNDCARPLTDTGRLETEAVVNGLKRLGVSADVVFTSPLVRARQTAEIIGQILGAPLRTVDALAPAGRSTDIFAALKEFAGSNDVFMVGHEPDVGRLVSSLLWAGPELVIPFKKSSVCRVDITSVPPVEPGTLEWFITPKIASLLDSGKKE